MTEEPPDDQLKNKKNTDVQPENNKALEVKRELREKNIECLKNKPDEDYYRSLDSNLRKTTSFVKRMKSLTDDKSHTLLTFDFFVLLLLSYSFSELGTLNLNRYISEIVTGIAEAKIKQSDLPYIVQVCSAMHQKYPSFSRALQAALLKSFLETTPDSFSSGSFVGEKGKDSTKDSTGILFALSSLGLTDQNLVDAYQQLVSSVPLGQSTLPLTTLSNALASQLASQPKPDHKEQLVIDIMMCALKQIGSSSTNAGMIPPFA